MICPLSNHIKGGYRYEYVFSVLIITRGGATVIGQKVQLSATTLGSGVDQTSGPEGYGPWSEPKGPLRYWHKLTLTAQFLTVATVIVCGSMAALGQWLSSRIEDGQIHSRANSGALYMEAFLAPHVRNTPEGPVVSPEDEERLDKLLIGTELAKKIEGMRIWGGDGRVIYSTEKLLMGKTLPSDDIDRAMTGEVVAQLEEYHDDDDDGYTPNFGYPLLEIYAPIYDVGSREIVAVGEFYEDGTEFFSYLRTSKQKTWGIVGLTTYAIMALLFLIVRRASGIIESQRARLSNQLLSAREMAAQNANLRNAADRARMDASSSNENLLNRIGADLHDGPIQLLSLLILKLRPGSASSPVQHAQQAAPPDETHPAALAQKVLTELRDLATGLVLPELERMSLQEALALAVENHERSTGTVVDAEYTGLPKSVAQPLKVCLYRVVQEGLNNSFRHADAREQRVVASADSKFITVVVSDGGPGIKPAAGSSAHAHPLGLHGIRHRVEAFGGTVLLRPRTCSGVELVATVPLDSNSGY